MLVVSSALALEDTDSANIVAALSSATERTFRIFMSDENANDAPASGC